MDIVSTDVLVVGGGLAGLLAAAAARQTGQEVVLCAKAPPGKASSSTLSQGSFRAAAGGFTPAQHRKLTLDAGRGLNEPALADVLAEEAAAAVRALRKFGVEVREREKGFYVPARKIGQEGVNVTGPLAEAVHRLGVKFLFPFLAFGLLQKDGQAAGVWGTGKKEDTPLAVLAKAVVLATGGAGAVFERTDNPARNTGDGYALAYRAGVPLLDLEFVQFYPLATAEPGRPGRFLPAVLADAGKLLNAAGEDLLEKYGIAKTPVAIVCRDLLSRAITEEVKAGRGIAGAVRLDFRDWAEGWRRAQKVWNYPPEELGRIQAWAAKLLAGRESVPVLPTAHFFMGGVAAGPRGQTGIPGLFAAGEVTGGLHGANRLGGNALTEAAVFGPRAGLAAAEFASGQKVLPLSRGEAEAVVAGCCESIREKCGHREKGTSYSEIRQKLRRVFWESSGVVRSASSLKNSLAITEELAGEITEPASGKPGQWFDFLEVLNLVLVSRLVAGAALFREESRGAHSRLDFPEQDDANWRKHTAVKCNADQPEFFWAPVGFSEKIFF